MSDLPHLAATKCPCNHPTCKAGNLSPITFAQGVMSLQEAQELAYRANAFPDLVALVATASALLADVRRRYPGEALRCPYMIALEAAVVKVLTP